MQVCIYAYIIFKSKLSKIKSIERIKTKFAMRKSNKPNLTCKTPLLYSLDGRFSDYNDLNFHLISFW